MASPQNKDAKVNLYLTVSRQFYYAGQFIQGVIYLDNYQDSSYKSINGSLIGVQEIEWDDKNINFKKYHNSKETYREQFVIKNFQQGLLKGQYQFPFNILLPSSLPASLHLNNKNYIKLKLKAYLLTQNHHNEDQSFQLSLNIQEPLRSVESLSESGTVIVKPEYCNCFGEKKTGIFHLQVNKNQVKLGEQFQIKGFIDNTNGQIEIDNFSVILSKKIVKISQNGQSKLFQQDICELIKTKKGVKKGALKKFDAKVNVPQKIGQYSAIGNILSRSFFIVLFGEINCYSQGKIQKHIMISKDTWKDNQKKDINNIFKDWKPIIFPQVSIYSLKPYIYQPNPSIKYTNQKGTAAFPISLIPMTEQNLIKV